MPAKDLTSQVALELSSLALNGKIETIFAAKRFTKNPKSNRYYVEYVVGEEDLSPETRHDRSYVSHILEQIAEDLKQNKVIGSLIIDKKDKASGFIIQYEAKERANANK